MKKLFLPILSLTIIFFVLMASSCSHNFYAPSTAVTPLFREKGETQLSAHIGSGNEIDQSFQLQGAYAYSSSMAFFGSYYRAMGSDDSIKNNNGNGAQLELALGHFKTLGKKTSFELYGGSGFGLVNNKYNPTYEVKNNFIKPFVQGNIGYRSAFVDAVFTTRLAFLHIGGISEHNDTGFVSKDVNRIKSQPNSFLIEPGITLRVGYEPLKLQLHLGRSFNINSKDYPQEQTVLSFGIVGMLNSASKKSKVIRDK